MRPARSVVAVVRARAGHILDDIARALDLAELARHAPAAGPARLVAAVASPFPYPAANSTPWQLEGAVLGLRALGCAPIRCATDHAVLRAHGVELGEAAGAFTIVLPTMKCDAAHTLAGATLLAAGRPAFALMDGTTAGDGPGPRALRPVVKDVLLASADPVALDAIAATMMGFDAEQIAHLRDAAAAGLGIVRRADIEVVGDVALAAQRWGFAVGGRLVDRLKESRGVLGELVARGAEAYREARWPLRDRAIFDHWREATAWGRLHDQYDALGALGAGRATRAGS